MARRMAQGAAIKLAMAAGLAIAAGAAVPATAQEPQFPAQQFGQAHLRYNQSLGGNDDYIRSQRNGVFEPLAEFNPADRFRIRSRPVGRLSMLVENDDGSEGVATCTGTLIARDRLITNYHCVPGFEGVVKAAIIHMGYLREDQEPVDAYRVDVKPLVADGNLDFSVLRVEGAPGDTYGVVELDPVEVEPNASLIIYHHPAGLPLRLTRFRCKAYSGAHYRGAEFRHRCDTLGGSSGSLIFDNDHKVVALHHSGGLTNDASSSFNSGTAIGVILARLGAPSSVPDGHGGADPSPNWSPSTGSESPAVKLPSAPAVRTTPAVPPARSATARIPSKISDNKLNVRTGAGLSHAVIGAIPAGANDVIYYPDSCRQAADGRTRKPWCRVSWRGLEGWASSGGLIPVRSAGGASPAARVMARIPSAISDNKLNVRSGAGLSHAVIGAIPAGADDVVVYPDTCRQAADGRTRKPWCRVSWRGLEGWASTAGLIW